MATGGITVDTMTDFFTAGAIAVGMANTLFGDFREPDRPLIERAVGIANGT